jgi:catechol 2,3-dioxygenase-like lactoylglutathione lyase family enzyme
MSELTRHAPYFPVADLDAALRHYEEVLGFRREYVAGDPPIFAIVSRGGLAIMLRLVQGAPQIVPNERQGGTWDVFFWVQDARALHDELAGRGATVVYPPTMQHEYHMIEFAVRDGEGYVLGFGQPAGS